MHILLDTHIYLWCLQDDPKLSGLARSRIVGATEVFVSSASIWEAAIKVASGKLRVDVKRLVKEISNSGFVELPISAKHAAMVASLPDIHRDPFDRILVAQAMCEPLRLITADSALQTYSELVEVV
jgi:PIN domain nuclease of toxin-antitoxin system